jgi:hypothetical protein
MVGLASRGMPLLQPQWAVERTAGPGRQRCGGARIREVASPGDRGGRDGDARTGHIFGLLVGFAVPAWSAQAASSGTGGALTCFAVDVSGSNVVASDGEPPSDPGPTFVRQRVVEPYDEVIADLVEAAGQQVGVARDTGQILTESQILMES